MGQSRSTSRRNKKPVTLPYFVVLVRYRRQDGWQAYFFDAPSDRLSAEEAVRSYRQDQDAIEVRFMEATMVSRYGPVDPGGLFNSDVFPEEESQCLEPKSC